MGGHKKRIWAVLILDTAIVVAAMILASLSHGYMQEWVSAFKRPPHFREYALLVYLVAPVWLVLIVRFDLHNLRGRSWSAASLFGTLFKLHLIALLILAVIMFAAQIVINRSMVGLFALWSFLLMFVARWLLLSRIRFLHSTGQGRQQILLVGTPSAHMDRLVQAAGFEPLPPKFVGVLTADPGQTAFTEKLKRLGDPEDLEKVLHADPVDAVIFFPPFNEPKRAQQAITLCQAHGKPAIFALDWLRPGLPTPEFANVFGFPAVEFEESGHPTDLLAIKHAMDFILALVSVIVLLPVFLITWLAVRIGLGKPVLFIQERIGLNGRRFRMYKFRSMVMDAEQHQTTPDLNAVPIAVKREHDKRVTRLGKILRRTSLDELPQLFNVLNGTMSLVGPRPLPTHEQQGITGSNRRRLSMRPGITGLWQTSGRSELGFARWMELDLQYINQWSLGLDLRILLRTFWVVFTGKGAR